MWVATVNRHQEIESRSFEEFGLAPTSLVLNAAQAVVEAIQEYLPDPARVSIFCGKGHNGADGFAVAAILARHRYHVECFAACEENELVPLCAHAYADAKAAGAEIFFHSDPRWRFRCDCIGCRDLVVDALLGTGSVGTIRPAVEECVRCINKSGVPVVSIDVPTGIDPDTGEELGLSVWAMRTVTFGLPKRYLFQGQGLEHAGFWTVAPINFPQQLLAEPTDAQLISDEWVSSLLPERLRASHKGENGHVLIVGGSDTMPGAAILAATSAVRSGAGLVTVASTVEVCRAVAANLPEVLIQPLPSVNGVITADAARILLANQHRYHSALFGPGLTHDQTAHEFLEKIWRNWQVPSLVDADALNCVSEGVPLPEVECLLTPHPGEMSRLLKMSIAEIQSDRFGSIATATERFQNTVILKGPYTLVSDLGQPIMVNTTGNPGMASGGMGDVLGGLASTLMAQGLPSYYAAGCAAHLHGLAGDHCMEEIGAVGYTAREVANAIPRARARMIAGCITVPKF